MQRPHHNKMINNFQPRFNPYYNQNYRSVLNPVQQPQRFFNQNRMASIQNHNEEHWCETCDRGFNSFEVLENHKRQHQKCNIDGCQFIAHPKVITKHIQMQHASGLYKKIAKLNNPEEIQKWREERKKKYPTKLNIEKKVAEIKEKIDRGEKMGLEKNRHHKQYNKGDPRNRKQIKENGKHNRRTQHSRSNNNSNFNKFKKPVLAAKVPKSLPSAENLRKLKPFNGIQDIVTENSSVDIIENTNCNFTIEDDEHEEVPKPVVETAVNDTEPKVCGALSSLMFEYDFSDDEDIDETKSNASKCHPSESKEIKVNLDNINNAAPIKVNEVATENYQQKSKSDDEGPEEIKINKDSDGQSEDKLVSTDNCIKPKKIAFIDKKSSRNNFTKPKHKKIPSTLLQKLLKREIQQERNIVLQCVRYIVKNKFYDKN